MRRAAEVSLPSFGQRAGEAGDIGFASVVGENRLVKIKRQRLMPEK